jgi:hypothetical protein
MIFQLARRGRDDAQHLCERSPLVARLLKFARLALQHPYKQTSRAGIEESFECQKTSRKNEAGPLD